MAAAHYKLDNLTAIVDRNRIQNDRFTDQVMELEPLPDKWRAFGWKHPGSGRPRHLPAIGRYRRGQGDYGQAPP